MNRVIAIVLVSGVGASVSVSAAAHGGETGRAVSKWGRHSASSRGPWCRDVEPKRAWPSYVALPVGEERPGSVGWAVNDFGVVAGQSRGPSEQTQATLWLRDQVIDLGTLGGGYSAAFGLNNRGQVVGYSGTEGEDVPFVWSDGEMHAIPGIPSGRANAINDRGQVVGTAYEGGWVRAFIYDGEELRYLSSTNGYVTASSINNRGQVVGSIGIGDGRYRAYLWEDGVFTDLEGLGGNYDVGTDINDHGVVVGGSFDGLNEHAVVWIDSRVSTLGVNEFFGEGYSVAWSINNRGEIVGENNSGWARAFYYRAGNVVDLNAITRSPSLPNNYAVAINQWGAIVGAAYDPLVGVGPATVWFPWW